MLTTRPTAGPSLVLYDGLDASLSEIANGIARWHGLDAREACAPSGPDAPVALFNASGMVLEQAVLDAVTQLE
jgi:hypothetical protein